MNVSDLNARFEAASKAIKGLVERPDNLTLLKLYALYKQGAEGDAGGAKPSFFDFVGTAKFEAWEKLKGMAKDEAMEQYIDLVTRLAD